MTHLHDVIVEQQPEAVALHNGDVMSSVWAAENTETNSECSRDPGKTLSEPSAVTEPGAERQTMILSRPEPRLVPAGADEFWRQETDKLKQESVSKYQTARGLFL